MEITYRKKIRDKEEVEDTTFTFEFDGYKITEIFADYCVAEVYDIYADKRIFRCSLKTDEFFFSDWAASKYLKHILELLDIGVAKKKAQKVGIKERMKKASSGEMDADGFIAQCQLLGIAGSKKYVEDVVKDLYDDSDIEALSRKKTDEASAKTTAKSRMLGNPSKHKTIE